MGKLEYVQASLKDYKRIISKWLKRYRRFFIIFLILWALFASIKWWSAPAPAISDQLPFEKVEAHGEVITEKPLELATARTIKVSEPVVSNTAPTQIPAGCVPDNPYASFIYFKESGCRPEAVNASGCRGIGQACPGSKIAHCGNDFACQHEWFSNYATSRYGGWPQAHSAWLSQGWW